MAAPPPSFQDTMHAAATINQAANAAGYMQGYTQQGYVQQQPGMPPPQGSGKPTVSIRFDASYIKTFPGMLKVAECVSKTVKHTATAMCVNLQLLVIYY